MAAFDRDLWKKRAEVRREKALKNARSEAKVSQIEAAYARDLDAISGIAKLQEWCDHRSVKVGFTSCYGGSFDPQTLEIEVAGRGLPESQLFLLLHECGHFLVSQHDKRISHGYNPKIMDERSLIAKVEILAEEFEAWSRGQQLAKRLRIFFNKERYNKFKASALNTYMLWR